jgi:hypothetical protein
MQQLWNASGNLPTAEQRHEMIVGFNNTLRRRRRQELCWLIWTFFVLTVLTAFVSWLLFTTNKVNLASEWGAIPLLLIPWVFAVIFLKRFLSRRFPVYAGDISISQSLAANLAVNKAERAKLETLGVMYLIAIPVLALCIWQLYSVGKISSRELISMVSFLGGALALSGGVVFAKYWLGLVPAGKKLNALLSQFEESVQ